MAERRHYRSYLLRMWQVGPESCDWRAMLENPSTGERQGFGNLVDLCDWIQAQAGEPEYRSTWQDNPRSLSESGGGR
jgi:hypothetical protein